MSVAKCAQYFLRNRTFATSVEGLPFCVTREQVSQKLLSSRHIMEPVVPQRPGIGSQKALAISLHDPISARFLPFHAANIQGLTSSVDAEYGVDRLESYPAVVGSNPVRVEMRTRVVTDWYKVARFTLPKKDYPFYWQAMQVYAGYKYPRQLVEEALGSTAVVDNRALTRSEVENDGCTTVDPFECKTRLAQSHQEQMLFKLESSRARDLIMKRYPRASRAHVKWIELHLDRVDSYTWHSFYVPAYVYQPEVNGTSTLRFVHGYTGVVGGRAQWSRSKIAGVAAVVGAIAGAAAVAAELISGMGMLQAAAVSTGGAAALAMACLVATRAWKQRGERRSRMSELKDNESRPSLAHDELLRKLLADLTASGASTVGHDDAGPGAGTRDAKLPVVRLSESDAVLLGVPPGSSLTLVHLKLAYLQQLRLWHPDVYTGADAAAAQATVKRLNERYTSLAAELKAAAGAAS